MRISKFMIPVLSVCLLQAQTPKPDMNTILKDVMKFQFTADQKLMAFWCPYEFLLAAGQIQNPDISEKSAETEMGFMRNYAIFMIQASREDEEGREISLSESQIKSLAGLSDNKNHTFVPVTDPPPKLTTLMTLMKAGVRSQKGTENMEFVVFNNKDAAGKPILQAGQPGSFTLSLQSGFDMKASSFTWQTPLESLAMATACTHCRNPLQATWKFCPMCGQPIKTK